MTKQQLAEVLAKHAEWLADSRKGARADLSYANLGSADLSYADLSYADLSYANLRSADLSYADLSYADLSYANLRSADLRSADLRSANLRETKWSTPLADQIKRLDAVRDIVLAKPERLYMSDWHKDGWTPDHTPEEEQSCGSAHCIAGWLQALSPDSVIRLMVPLDAGLQLAPIAAPQFYANDDEVLEWFKAREYAKTEATA